MITHDQVEDAAARVREGLNNVVHELADVHDWLRVASEGLGELRTLSEQAVRERDEALSESVMLKERVTHLEARAVGVSADTE